jgi:hypothetical protein
MVQVENVVQDLLAPVLATRQSTRGWDLTRLKPLPAKVTPVIVWNPSIRFTVVSPVRP